MQPFKRYLVFQGMMFVFGIVGPIFLIGYFMSRIETRKGRRCEIRRHRRSTAISPELTIADRRIP